MPENSAGLGYEPERMIHFEKLRGKQEVKGICFRCGSEKVAKIEPNERGKDRRCGSCGIIWEHTDPEGSWSMIGL